MEIEGAALPARGGRGVAFEDLEGDIVMVFVEEEGESEAGGASADDCDARGLRRHLKIYWV